MRLSDLVILLLYTSHAAAKRHVTVEECFKEKGPMALFCCNHGTGNHHNDCKAYNSPQWQDINNKLGECHGRYNHGPYCCERDKHARPWKREDYNCNRLKDKDSPASQRAMKENTFGRNGGGKTDDDFAPGKVDNDFARPN